MKIKKILRYFCCAVCVVGDFFSVIIMGCCFFCLIEGNLLYKEQLYISGVFTLFLLMSFLFSFVIFNCLEVRDV